MPVGSKRAIRAFSYSEVLGHEYNAVLQQLATDNPAVILRDLAGWVGGLYANGGYNHTGHFAQDGAPASFRRLDAPTTPYAQWNFLAIEDVEPDSGAGGAGDADGGGD